MTNYDQFCVQVLTTTTYGVTMVVQYMEHMPRQALHQWFIGTGTPTNHE